MSVGLVAIGGPGWMGGEAYVRNIALAIRAASPKTRVVFICAEEHADAWAPGGFPVVPVPIDRRRGWRRLLPRSQHPLAVWLEMATIDFLYPLTYDNRGTLGLDFPVGRKLGYAGWAGWIPDFQHRYLPQFFSQAELDFRDRNIALLAQEAPALVLSSESAKADLAKFVPQAVAKAQTLRFATSPDPAWYADAPPEFECPARFLIVCNQFWAHKNHLLVFEALRILKDRGIRPLVLCTGKLEDHRNQAYAGEVRQKIEDGGLGEQIRLLGLISRATQLQLMRRALAIIQPSLFEGWSTVVEDARIFGRPCILSDLPVHLEQAPPGARYFPRSSAEELAAAIADIWEHGTPGPDLAAESAARAAADRAFMEFGERFVKLARGN